MANKNNLFIENHRLKEKLSDDRSAFQRLLTTMARFHRYSVDQQMNLYEHAPAGAMFVSLKVWLKSSAKSTAPKLLIFSVASSSNIIFI